LSLSPLLSRYDQLILDLDGCVWLGDSAVDGSVEAIGALRDAGKRVAFVTNESRSASEELVRKLWGLGVQASLGDVVTSGGAMQHLLAETRTGRTAFVIGTEALMRNVEAAGLKVMNGTDLASRAEVVVVAGTFDLHYEDLRDATLALRRGADFLATSRDPTYPAADGMWPGTGAILAAVETAAERKAAIVGKPEPQVFFTALERLGEGRTLVVGDRLDSDIAAAAKAKLDSALVLTGGATRDELGVKGEAQPTVVADSLSSLVSG
jgi:HAD superfamily hydrolase (TIGR01450 family)